MQDPKDLALLDAMQDMIATPATPEKQFGHLPTPYSEAAQRRDIAGSTGMTAEARRREGIAEDGDNLDAVEMMEDEVFHPDLSVASYDNADSIIDGDMQSYIDLNH